jgi:hypothetical protein
MLNAVKEKLHIFSAWKEFVASFLVILLCLVFSSFFPAEDYFQKLLRALVFLLIIPILYIRLVLKRDLYSFGCNFSLKKSGIFWAIGIFLFTTTAFILLANFTNFRENYFIAEEIRHNFTSFLFYELVVFNFFFLLNEFFFKGFVLFSFSEKLKDWSIWAATATYCLSLLASGNFSWQTAPLIAYSLGGTIISYKNNSFWLSYLTGFVSIILLDSLLIYISK